MGCIQNKRNWVHIVILLGLAQKWLTRKLWIKLYFWNMITVQKRVWILKCTEVIVQYSNTFLYFLYFFQGSLKQMSVSNVCFPVKCQFRALAHKLRVYLAQCHASFLWRCVNYHHNSQDYSDVVLQLWFNFARPQHANPQVVWTN